jgi:hypothetical protein
MRSGLLADRPYTVGSTAAAFASLKTIPKAGLWKRVRAGSLVPCFDRACDPAGKRKIRSRRVARTDPSLRCLLNSPRNTVEFGTFEHADHVCGDCVATAFTASCSIS